MGKCYHIKGLVFLNPRWIVALYLTSGIIVLIYYKIVFDSLELLLINKILFPLYFLEFPKPRKRCLSNFCLTAKTSTNSEERGNTSVALE